MLTVVEYGPRAMVAEDIGMFPCRFGPAYQSQCGYPTLSPLRLCPAHDHGKCGVCGELQTHECSYCGQFVCGFPLCDNCEGFEDQSKASGAWGFLNHSHRRRAAAPPLRKMVAGDIGIAS